MNPSFLAPLKRRALGLAALVLVCAAVVSASAPTGQYSINAGAVTDSKTGLIWQQVADTTSYSYANAKAHCASLGSTWRAPSMKELETLVDDSRSSPAIETTVFTGATGDPYWTSTPAAGNATQAWVVYFYDGSAGPAAVTSTYPVRCVR